MTDAGVVRLDVFTQLETLVLGETQITDAGLECLNGLAKLQTLDLAFTKISDAGLEHIKALIRLRSLNLKDTAVTDAGLQHLESLANLQTLDLSFDKVGDVGLEHLKQLTSLESLSLGHRSFSGGGAGFGLRQTSATSRQSRSLSRTQVTDAGLEQLKELTKLQSLNLEGTEVTGEGPGLPQGLNRTPIAQLELH